MSSDRANIVDNATVSLFPNITVEESYQLLFGGGDMEIPQAFIDSILESSAKKNGGAEKSREEALAPEEPEKKKRKKLPAGAIDFMDGWLIEHKDNPYPDEATKQLFAERFGIEKKSVEVHFVNQRRRLLGRRRGQHQEKHAPQATDL